MTISKNNDNYDIEIKSLLCAKYAISSKESLEGLIDEINIILNRVRNAECSHNQVKKYQEELEEMFFKGKQLISLLNNMKDDFVDEDKKLFSDLKSQFAMLNEANELIDFEAVLDYTLTNKVIDNN